MHAYSFEKLDVWQRGRELNKQVYHLDQDSCQLEKHKRQKNNPPK